ncbi:MAG: hypothetical protein MPN21_19915 [Thermoanaerobaculia bacterium]|nr:hypothetical protein [Thermoanaerobaculia bacterium]
MIQPEALEQIDQLQDEAPFSLVVEWSNVRSALDRVREEPPGPGRQARLRHELKQMKTPLLSQLREQGARVRDQEMTPTAVVEAAPDTWKRLTAKDGILATDAEVRVLPNAVFVAHDSD